MYIRGVNRKNVMVKSGVKLVTQNTKSILESRLLFFLNKMLEHIVKYTHINIEKINRNCDYE